MTRQKIKYPHPTPQCTVSVDFIIWSHCNYKNLFELNELKSKYQNRCQEYTKNKTIAILAKQK